MKNKFDAAWLIPFVIIGGMLWAAIVEIKPEGKPMRYSLEQRK